jgi:hypothetical protein
MCAPNLPRLARNASASIAPFEMLAADDTQLRRVTLPSLMQIAQSGRGFRRTAAG